MVKGPKCRITDEIEMNNRKNKTLLLSTTILVLVLAPSGNLHANRKPSSFEQFRTTHKTGLVLSRDTGFRRNYGRNPYVGYDDIGNKPFMYHGREDPRLKPMEKLITVNINNISKAYPYSITRDKRVINDDIGGEVIFHDRGAASALDKAEIAQSREDGSTGVFSRKLAGQLLTFSKKGETFVDDRTSSIWDITGRAIQGELKGKKLSPVVHGDYFAFAWLVFKPETKIYTD